MNVGQIFLVAGAAAAALFALLGMTGQGPFGGPAPELVPIGIMGCPNQNIAVSLTRALYTRGANSKELIKWSKQNGCGLVPPGTYVTSIEEGSGHAKITKVSANGDVVYLIGLPRPAPK